MYDDSFDDEPTSAFAANKDDDDENCRGSRGEMVDCSNSGDRDDGADGQDGGCRMGNGGFCQEIGGQGKEEDGNKDTGVGDGREEGFQGSSQNTDKGHLLPSHLIPRTKPRTFAIHGQTENICYPCSQVMETTNC